MLKSMRRSVKSTFVKVALFGFLVISFGLWGVTDLFYSRPETQTVAWVGDKTLAFNDYYDRFQKMLQQTGLSQAGIDITPTTGRIIEELVLNDWSVGVALDQELAKLRLAVTDAVLRDSIRRNPDFRDSQGNFSRRRFESFLAQNGLNEELYLSQLRADILRNQWFFKMLDAMPVPKQQERLLRRYRQTYRSGQMLTITSAQTSTSDNADTATLRQYYNDHLENFRLAEQRAVRLLSLTLDAIAERSSVSQEQLERYYTESLPQFRTPERRTVERILFADKSSADQASMELKLGKDFVEIARRIAGRGAEELSLGDVTAETLFDQTLAEQAFALEENIPSPPFESSFGWTIVRVTKITPAAEPGLAELRETLEQELKHESAASLLFDYVDEIEDKLAGGAPLKEIAETLPIDLDIETLNLSEDSPLTSDLLWSQTRQIDSVGEIRLFDDGTGGYRVIALDKIVESTIPPYEDVRERVRLAWENDQRQQAILDEARQIAQAISQGLPMKEAADDRQAEILTIPLINRDGSLHSPDDQVASQRFEPQQIQQLFALEPQRADAVPSIEGAQVIWFDGEELFDDTSGVVTEELKNQMMQESFGIIREYLQQRYPMETDRTALDYIYTLLGTTINPTASG